MPEAKIHTLAAPTHKERIAMALNAERNGNIDRAIQLYEQAIQKKPLEENAHKRLMVIYRKNKNLKKEIAVLNRAIKIWRDHFELLQKALHAKNPARAKIKKLSLQIEKKLGGHYTEPEPIARWLKRKQLLVNKSSSTKKSHKNKRRRKDAQ